MAIPLKFLSLGPRISKHDLRLSLTTGWGLCVVTLGMWYRRVVVDVEQQAFTFHARYLWLFTRTRRISFRSVAAVTYGYSDWSPSGYWNWAHDSLDVFTVGLRLYGEEAEEIGLFDFVGDGTFTNDGPWPDWMYWPDYIVDLSGTQERDSKAFVDLLCKILGVRVQPPNCAS
jgi:hypothetical protein